MSHLPPKRGCVGLQHFPEIAVDECTGLEALSEIAELLVEHAQTGLHVLQRRRRRRGRPKPFLHDSQVGKERRDVLHRPVVNVEAEANQAPLGDVENRNSCRGHWATRLSSRPIPWLYAHRTASARFLTSILR